MAVGDADPFGLRMPQLFPGTGDGLLGAARDLDLPPDSPGEYFVKDFDLDGVDDLAVAQGAAEQGSEALRAGIYYDGAEKLVGCPHGSGSSPPRRARTSTATACPTGLETMESSTSTS